MIISCKLNRWQWHETSADHYIFGCPLFFSSSDTFLVLKNQHELIWSFKKALQSNLKSFMIHIYKDELDETEIKLMRNEFIKVKESRTAATFRLYQF